MPSKIILRLLVIYVLLWKIHGQGVPAIDLIEGQHAGILSGHQVICDSGITNPNTSFPIKLVKESKNSNVYKFNLIARIVDDCKPEGKNCMGKYSDTVKFYYRCGTTQLTTNIYVNANQDNCPPFFCNASCSEDKHIRITIPENTTSNTKLYSGRICDLDSSSDASNDLRLNDTLLRYQRNGPNFDLILTRTLDYDLMPDHVINIDLTAFSTNHNSSIVINVKVTDIDDHSPIFSEEIYSCNVPEANYTGTGHSLNCSVLAYDQDRGLDTKIVYEKLSVYPVTDAFSIKNDGTIEVTGTLDREKVSTYTLSLKCHEDGRSEDRFNYSTVIITVSDVDDNSPVISSDVYSTSIPENTDSGTIVFQLTVTDRDEGENAKCNFTLEQGSLINAFKIDTTLGRITVDNSTVLDRETLPGPLKLHACAIESISKAKKDCTDLTVQLTDINDNSPKFVNISYAKTIQKTNPLHNSIIQVSANDPDKDENGIVIYTIKKTNDELPFEINKTTGKISLTKTLNETYDDTYTLFVKAEDQCLNKAERRESVTAVTIHVLDVNIHPPTITLLSSHTNISEASNVGTVVATLQITDKDRKDNLTVEIIGIKTFVLTQQQDKSIFEISLAELLDREAIQTFKLVVSCTDTVHAVTKTIHIEVLDENDNSPIFNESIYNFTTIENKKECFGTVKATDLDAGGNQRLQYSIVPVMNDWSSNFTIDKINGTICAVTPLDREVLGEGDIVTLSVQAVDKGVVPRTGIASVVITIQDVNDNAPEFPEDVITFTVNELDTPTFNIAMATDKDIGDNMDIEYSIRGTSALFELTKYGNLTAKSTLINTKENETIALMVVAKNKEPLVPGTLHDKNTLNVYIHIQDVNDNNPHFMKPSYNFSVVENTSPGTLIGSVSAIDDDVSPLYNTVSYWTEHNDVTYIDFTTGALYLARVVDFDNNEVNFNIKIYSSDMQPSLKTNDIVNTSVNVEITVTHYNDYTPTFTKDHYECSVNESYTGPITCNDKIHANDMDRGDDGVITYSLLNNQSRFTIDNSSGMINLIESKDYENVTNPKQYALVVQAKDNGHPSKSVTANLTVFLKDINDHAPFIRPPRAIDIPENYMFGGTIIGRINAKHTDVDDILTYSTCGKSNSDFYVRPNDGTIAVKRRTAFDYETQTNFNFSVCVSDSIHEANQTVHVEITPVNEFAPTVNKNESCLLNIEENKESTCQFQAFDGDDGNDGNIAKYMLMTQSDWQHNISINETTGLLTIDALDRDMLDMSGEITVTVMAEDGGTPPFIGTKTVTFQVEGVNDNAPYYLPEDKKVNITLEENKDNPDFFKSLAFDSDKGNGSVIKYIIVDKSSSFSITDDGVVSSSKLIINENKTDGDVLHLQIEAYNEEPYYTSGMNNASHDITVHIKDVNNHIPKFQKLPYKVTISECMETGYSLFQVTADDLDTTKEFNTVTYWIDGQHSDQFRMDSRTGSLTLVEKLDYDILPHHNTYSIQVYATDLESLEKNSNHTAKANININILDCNDNLPIFDKETYVCKLDEGYTGEINCTVRATDLDMTGEIIYEIEQEKYNFLIANDNGTLSIHSPYDYDGKDAVRMFQLNISASSQNDTSFATVLIMLQNKNDEIPKFDNHSYQFNIPENNKANNILGLIHVTDRDGDDIKLSLAGGDTTDFRIGTNGELIAAKSFDYENKTSYNFTVQATDTVDPVYASILVNIVDVNDNTPIFAQPLRSIHISENIANGTSVINVTATDADASNVNNVITYSQIGGNKDNPFTLNNKTGEIKVVGVLNASSEQKYDLVIQAHDNGHPILDDISTVTIYIDDINDNFPLFLNAPYHTQITEGQTFEYRVYAEDRDVNSTLTYTVVSPKESAGFSFTNNLLQSNTIDAEKHNGSIQVTIMVSDGERNDTTTVNITIIDINDNTPSFVNAPYIKDILDTSDNGAYVLAVTANDTDVTNTGFTYILYGSYGDFTINQTNGEVSVQKAKERQWIKGKTYNMKVVAIDSGSPPRSNETEIIVNINETNLHAPNITGQPITFNFNENNGKSERKVNARDVDKGQNITFKLSSAVSNNCSLFQIDSNTGSVTLVNPVDFESLMITKFSCIVTVTDDAQFPKTSTAIVSINIDDINDNPPYFLDAPYHTQITEGQTIEYTVYAEDKDVSSTLTYTVVSPISSAGFSFTNNVLQSKPIDAEEYNGSVLVTIMVSDGIWSATTNVTITIIDINDNTPYFVNASYISYILDTSVKGYNVLAVTANDADVTNTGFTYILYRSYGDFTINQTNGALTVQKSKERQWIKGNVYNMKVVVIDSGNPPNSNETEIIIYINETNVHAPNIAGKPIIFNFDENDGKSERQITATDDDVTQKLTYELFSDVSNNCSLFQINSTTGIVTLVNSVDFESLMIAKFSCIVTVADDAQFPKTSTAKVYINIVDVDEKPTLEGLPTTVYKEKNSTKGSVISNIKVIDPDINKSFRNFSFSLQTNPDNSYFEIDNNGTIFVNNTLRQPENYYLNVTVTDGGGLKDSNILTVIVSDVIGCILKPFVYENTKSALLYDLHNASYSCLVEEKLNFTLAEVSDKFKIAPNNSLLSIAAFDFEKTKSINFEIEGKDENGILKAQYQVQLTIIDENDCPPHFNKSSYHLNVKDGSPNGTYIDLVTASDVDSTALLYSIYENQTMFTIDKTGGIRAQAKIYYSPTVDNPVPIFTITVICSDTRFSVNTSVFITVTDNPPYFTNSTYRFTVKESEAIGAMANILVGASDPDVVDKSHLNYSVATDNDSYIDINPVTGQLHLLRQLDFDTMNDTTISVTVHVSDLEHHTDTAAVLIVIEDVNDNPPVFEPNMYIFNVKEGIAVQGNNFSVFGSDSDSGINKEMEFTLQNDYNGVFNITKISANKGAIQILTPLDRENTAVQHLANGTATWQLIVIATDHGQPPMSSSATVLVYVEDVNDCSPTFKNTSYTEFVQEGTEIGFKIATITATDADFDPAFKDITYGLEGDGHDTFNITKDGKILLNKHVSRSVPFYKLTVIAFDGVNNGSTSLNITILDTNDHSPVFDHPIYQFNISETNDTNVSIGAVLATDEDPGINGQVTYNITSGNIPQHFKIMKELDRTGLIQTVSQLDREKESSYVLIITATDSAKKGKREGTCTVSVRVMDVNDNYPIFGELTGYRGTVEEDARFGTPITMKPTAINALDVDSDENGTPGITYVMLTDNGSESVDTVFCIDNTTAIVSVCRSLDREDTDKYSYIIIATDGGGLNTTTNLTITVDDVNDEPPQFVNVPYNFSVTEDTTAAMTVGDITVTDADVNGLANIRFEITHGDDDKFYIDNNGTIRVSGNLDREIQDVYNLTVRANDGINKNSTTATIYIMDFNDNAPQFNKTVQSFDVVENTVPAMVYRVSAYDKDEKMTDNSRISYFFKGIRDGFNISEDGIISTTKALDREEQSSYALTVIATDHGIPKLSSETAITVNVLDVNDHSPVFCNEGKCNVTEIDSYIVEKSPVGSVIALPVVKDSDYRENGTISFSIEKSATSKYFSIDNTTGLVKIASTILINSLIHENNVTKVDNITVINVTIIARDHGPNGGRNSTLVVKVTVEETNDNAPVFKEPTYRFKVAENQQKGTVVGFCVAGIPNSQFTHMTYTLIPDEINFTIDPHNGTVQTSRVLDRETQPSYILSVKVTDGRTPERTAYAAIEVTIDDTNDNPPRFYRHDIMLNIPENNNWTQPINVSAFDNDQGNNALLLYTLTDTFDNLFHIDNATGMVMVTSTFDHEILSKYILDVFVEDKGIPPLNASTTVTINVLDVNDNSPIFYNILNWYNITENYKGEAFKIFANDSDSGLNGRIIYSVLQHDGPFTVDSLDGTVSVVRDLDYETQSQYNIKVEACDQGQPPECSQTILHVNVTDVYDFVPKFTKDVYEVGVNSTAAVNSLITTVNAGKGNISYAITDPKPSYFTINSSTGAIYLAEHFGKLDKEYSFTVEADNKQGTVAKCEVIVHVLGHAIVFQQSELNLTLSENLNFTAPLIDINTTDELAGLEVQYSIDRMEPDVDGLFEISPADGKLWSLDVLDREETSRYTLYISAKSSTSRTKREISRSSPTLKLTVNVGDTNDNPPTFSAKQQVKFGVPFDARANYVVTQLQAFDPDVGENGRVLYSAVAGNTSVFGIDQVTGDVKALVAMASLRDDKFYLTVVATDMQDPSMYAEIKIQISIIPREDRLVLLTNIPLQEFQHRRDEIISNMSGILGVDIQLEDLQPHVEQTVKGTMINLTMTDLTFHGINKTTGVVVPYDTMIGLINQASGALSSLLGKKVEWTVSMVPKQTHIDPSAITMSQIVLICIAVIIFFGSLVALFVAQYSWTRYEHEAEKNDKYEQQVQFEELELESMNSRRSSRRQSRAAAAAINPAFQDTNFNQGNMSKNTVTKTVYESQELRMDFLDEPIDAGLPNAPGLPEEQHATHSIADSGVENTSDHSDDRRMTDSSASGSPRDNRLPGDGLLIIEEGPVMTSSPRISREANVNNQGDISVAIYPPNGYFDKTNDRNAGTATDNTGLKSWPSVDILVDVGESETDIADGDDLTGDTTVDKGTVANVEDASAGTNDVLDRDIKENKVRVQFAPSVEVITSDADEVTSF